MPVSRVVVPVSWLLVPVSRVVVPVSRVVVPVSWLLVPVSRVVVPVPRASWLAVKASLASSPARTIPGQKCQSHHGMELHMAHAEKLTSLLGLQGDASLQGGGASLLAVGASLQGGGASLQGGGASLLAVGASLQGGGASLQGLLAGGEGLLGLIACKDNSWSEMPIPPWNGTAYGACRETHQSSGPPG